MGAGIRLPEAGVVEIIAGDKGSGKSLHCVKRVLDIIQQERRPVFTNLPIRWRVLRQYLRIKSGPAYANLIYPLNMEHFDRFIDRQHRRMQIRERLNDEARRTKRVISSRCMEAAYEAELGPDIYEGPDANAILPAAYVIIDECHHWFPMQGGKERDEILQRYLSMCRHHLHQVILVSQAPMQISKAGRRLATLYTICRHKTYDRIAWGVRFQHLGIRALGMIRYSADDIEGEEPIRGAEPMEQSAIYPWAPCTQVLFRLYSSHTHIGTPRRMLRTLDEVRGRLGVLDEDRRIRSQREQWRKERPVRMIRRFRKAAFAATLLTLGIGVGLAAGRAGRSQPEYIQEQAINEGLTEKQAEPDYRVRAMARDRVNIEGAWYAANSTMPNGEKVLYVARDGCIIHADGMLYTIDRKGTARLGDAAEIHHRAFVSRLNRERGGKHLPGSDVEGP